MPKKYLTFDDLLLFCEQQNFSHFSAKDGDGPIVIQTPGIFSAEDHSKDGLLSVKLQACHTKLNRNQSYISEENMKKALPSFSNRPIMGFIHQLDDGSWDFHSHDAIITNDGENDEGTIEYLEIPVGVIPESCNAQLVYDEEKQRTYVEVNGYIYEEYSKAAEILQEQGEHKVSVEIAIYEMSYNAKEKYLNITDFYFSAVTILGRNEDGSPVHEGMAGSNITLGSFSQENNSVVNDDINKKLFEMLTKLNDTLDNLNKNNKKGAVNNMNKFNELLEQYNVTIEDVTFEYEGVADEELEKLFAEHFDKTEPVAEPEPEKFVLSYELFHEDIRAALYNLLGAANDSVYTFIVEVYDDYFVYEKWNWDDGSDKFFRQHYTKNGDEVSLSDEAVEVFPMFATNDEKNALELMRTQFDELKQFKADIEKQADKEAKEAIFARKEYGIMAENEKFIELKNKMDEFSVEDIENQAKLIFAECVMASGTFSANDDNEEKKVNFNLNTEHKKSAYSGLFD